MKIGSTSGGGSPNLTRSCEGGSEDLRASTFIHMDGILLDVDEVTAVIQLACIAMQEGKGTNRRSLKRHHRWCRFQIQMFRAWV